MNTPSPDILDRLDASDAILHNAGHGRLDKLREAIDRGGDVNYVRADQSPVFVAIHRRFVDCAVLLLEKGADANLGTRARWRPLHEVAHLDYEELVAPLVKHGANVNATDFGGVTPLLSAAQSKSVKTLRRLIEAGALVDMADYEGITPLIAAVKAESPEATLALLNAGANPMATTVNGETALGLASKANWGTGVSMLQSVIKATGNEPAKPPVEPEVAAEPEPQALPVSRIGKRAGPR